MEVSFKSRKLEKKFTRQGGLRKAYGAQKEKVISNRIYKSLSWSIQPIRSTNDASGAKTPTHWKAKGAICNRSGPSISPYL